MAALHGPGALRVPGRDRRDHEHDAPLRLGPRSERLVDATPWGPWTTTTFVAGLRASGLVAPWVIGGAMDGAAFRTYAEQVLVPKLRKDEFVVMDNLPAHKVAGVQDTIRAAGASVLSLPPYSPDLNPIEQLFAKLKAMLRSAAARTKDAIWGTIGQALDVFPEAECQNYLAHCGYEFTRVESALGGQAFMAQPERRRAFEPSSKRCESRTAPPPVMG